MGLRDQIEKRVLAKQAEIAQYEHLIAQARVYMQGMQDVLKMLPREESDRSTEEILRAGSTMAKAREALQRARGPLHINEILKAIGKDRSAKSAVSGSLGNYVRRGEIFTRPAPNTFGLKEFQVAKHSSTDDDLPEFFGEDVKPGPMPSTSAGISDDDIPF